MPKKKYNFPLGELNPISYAGSTRHRNISRNDIIDNPLAAHQRVLKGAYAPQLFNGAKVFKAIVLKKVDVNISNTSLGNVLSKISEVFNISERKSVYICRIPEVHAHLPDPFGITGDADKRSRVIDMYPTFFPISQADDKISLSTDTINPGSIVEIEFSDASMSNGILKKVVKLSTHVEIPENQIENFQFKHGELNPTQFSTSRGARYSSKNIIDNPAAVHNDMTSRRAAQTMFKKGKVFRAIVMKVESVPSNSDPLSNLLSSIFPTTQRQNVHICRVPELHAHLPDPILMKDEDKKRALQYYPRFVFNPVKAGRTSYENEAKEGSIVEVEFDDQTFSTGMVKKVVKANANYEPTSPSASEIHRSGPASTINEKVALSAEAQFKADYNWATEGEAKVYGILSADFDRLIQEGTLTREAADAQLAVYIESWHSSAIERGDTQPLVVAPGQETPTVPIVLLEQAE